MLYGLSRMSATNTRRYENQRIAGVVKQVIGFNRGFPILLINGQQTYIHRLPPDFGKYILPGDSICKQKGEFTVVSYRKIQDCVEIITWQYGIRNGYEQPDIRTEKRCR